MKTTTDKKLSMYKYAAMCKLNLQSTDFEIQPDHNGYVIKTKDGNVYNIQTEEDLKKQVMNYLDEPQIFIPVNYWISVAEKVHTEKDFHKHFMAILKKQEDKGEIKNKHATKILKAFNDIISKKLSEADFWREVAESIDDAGGELYNYCVWASVRTYDKKEMMNELCDEFISNKYFNEMINGVFYSFFIREDEGDDFHLSFDDNDILFYIYSVDPASWEVKEVTNG
jgi:hypothetical protein